MTKPQLPLGIRNNNPGNLRHGIIPEIKSHVIKGFAVFQTTHDGLTELAYWLKREFGAPGKHTLKSVMFKYAPPSENDSVRYLKFVSAYVRMSEEQASKRLIQNPDDWFLFDCMRAIVMFENGYPPRGLSIGGEWFSAASIWRAIQAMRNEAWEQA